MREGFFTLERICELPGASRRWRA